MAGSRCPYPCRILQFRIRRPDNSFVRVVIGTDDSSVAASGRTRVDVVAAVLRGLDNCKRPADGVTVGPWLRFPETAIEDANKRPQLTVCIGDRMERGTSTAYIAITPQFPFSIVTAVTSELRSCGFTDVRLLSEREVTEIMALTANPVPNARVAHKDDSRD
jgi:hypothetical protein